MWAYLRMYIGILIYRVTRTEQSRPFVLFPIAGAIRTVLYTRINARKKMARLSDIFSSREAFAVVAV